MKSKKECNDLLKAKLLEKMEHTSYELSPISEEAFYNNYLPQDIGEATAYDKALQHYGLVHQIDSPYDRESLGGSPSPGSARIINAGRLSFSKTENLYADKAMQAMFTLCPRNVDGFHHFHSLEGLVEQSGLSLENLKLGLSVAELQLRMYYNNDKMMQPCAPFSLHISYQKENFKAPLEPLTT
jgi:hypothetical protein